LVCGTRLWRCAVLKDRETPTGCVRPTAHVYVRESSSGSSSLRRDDLSAKLAPIDPHRGFDQNPGLSPFSGGYCEGETPLPIPNRAVKPLSADGTWLARAWESRTPPVFFTYGLVTCLSLHVDHLTCEPSVTFGSPAGGPSSFSPRWADVSIRSTEAGCVSTPGTGCPEAGWILAPGTGWVSTPEAGWILAPGAGWVSTRLSCRPQDRRIPGQPAPVVPRAHVQIGRAGSCGAGGVRRCATRRWHPAHALGPGPARPGRPPSRRRSRPRATGTSRPETATDRRSTAPGA
jgi:hypothetical protein